MIERLTSYVARRRKRIRDKKSSVRHMIVFIGSILIAIIVSAYVRWELLELLDESMIFVLRLAVVVLAYVGSLAAGVFAGYACMFLEDALDERREKWRGNY